MLLYAFLLVSDGRYAPDTVNRWAQTVLRERVHAEQLKEAWKPPRCDEWKDYNKVAGIYVFLERALSRRVADADLDTIGEAIQCWQGAGVADGLRKPEISRYINRPPLGPRKDKKTPAKARWRSWSVVRVAELVANRGDAQVI